MKLTTVVKRTENSYVLVDSCNTIDHGYETMIFECDEEGNVSNWNDIDADWYDTEEEMKIGHQKMCEKWKLN